MKINFKKFINGYDGKPMLKPGEKEGGADMMLGHMAMVALNAMQEKDKDLSAEKKIHRAILSQEIYNATEKESADGNIDIISDDAAMIKELMLPLYGPAAIKAAYDLIDPPKPKVVEKTSGDSK